MLVHVVKETDAGIIIRGAKYETAAAYSNQAFLKPTIANWGDSKLSEYALGGIVKMDAPGVKHICRTGFTGRASERDYPLSNKFDEVDTLMILDNVLIPWEDILFYQHTRAAAFIRQTLHRYSAFPFVQRTLSYADLIIGAPYANVLGRLNTGRSFVVFGKTDAQAVKAAMQHGTIDGLSIGYGLNRDDVEMVEKEDGMVRIIKNISELYEISIVTYPADDSARVDLSSVKNALDLVESIKDFEDFLREAGGFSKSLATATASRAKRLFSQSESENQKLPDELQRIIAANLQNSRTL